MDETPQKRSSRAQDFIDHKLSNYFADYQLNELTDDEIDILAEYFSNQQYRELKNAPAQVIKGLLTRHVKTVERQRLTNIPEDEYDQMLEYYKEHADEVEEVVCQRCKNVIALEIKHSEYKSDKYFNNPNMHWQGRFVIAVGNRLMGYRKRLDDVMGYRCGCVIDNPAFLPAKEQYEKDVATFEKRVKKWDEDHAAYVEKREAYLDKYRPDFTDPGDAPLPLEAWNIPKSAGPVPTWQGGERPMPPVPPQMPAKVLCGNESTMSEPEIEAIPDEHLAQNVITQADIMKVKQHISKTEYEKPVKKVKTGYELDGKFLLRKVK